MNLRSIPLRLKVALVIGGGMLLFLGVTLLSLFVITQRDFDHIVRDLARQRIQRVVNYFALRSDTLRSSVADNAVWDETYAFAKNPRGDYLSRNYNNNPNLIEPYDFVLIYGADQKFLGAVTHFEGDRYNLDPPEGFDPSQLVGTSLLSAPDGASAIIAFGNQKAIVAAHDIVTSDGSGPSAGSLVYGRILCGPFIEELQATTGVTLFPENEPHTAHLDPPLPISGATGKFRFHVVGNWSNPEGPEAWLETTALNGQTIYFRLRFEPANFADIARSPSLFVATVALGGLLLVAAGLFLLEMNVLRVVTSLDHQMAAVAENPSSGQIHLDGSQEFTRLAASANRMVGALREEQSALAAERRLLHSVLDAAAEGLLAFRAERDSNRHVTDFRLERANPAGCRLLGIPCEEAEGWSMQENLSRVEDGAALWGSLLHVLETGEPRHLVGRAHFTAEPRWHDRQITRWGDGVVLSLSDVTAQRQAEENLRSTLTELERFNHAMLNREERVLELKQEVNAALAKTGQPPRYSAPT